MVGIEDLLAGLERVSKAGEGWSALCPAHEDRNPSLSIGLGGDGRILLRCHAGCDTSAIVGALGYELKDLFPQDTNTVQRAQGPRRPSSGSSARKSPLSLGTLDAAIAAAKKSAAKELGAATTLVGDYSYALVNGGKLRVFRFENDTGKKTFRQISSNGEGWVAKGSKSKALPFRHEAVARADTIWVAEGERCVGALVDLGIEATTSAGGANAAQKTDWSSLKGKALVLVPDNDDPGAQYVNAVQQLVKGRSVRLLELPGLEVGEDVVDLIERMRTEGHDDPAIKAELLRLASEAPAAETEARRPSREPFPLELLPAPVRAMVDSIASSRAVDPSAVAAVAVAAISAAVGLSRVYVDEYGDWKETGTIWLALVAPSGSRKSIIIEDLFAPHVERQRRLAAEYKAAEAQYSKDLEQWESRRKRNKSGDDEPRPTPPKFEHIYSSDTTPEGLIAILDQQPRGILLLVDELTSLFGSFGRYGGSADADRSLYLSLFRTQEYKKDRAGAPPIFIENASARIVGGIQPRVLAKVFNDQAFASGLAARFLLVNLRQTVKRYGPGPSPQEKGQYKQFIDALYELAYDSCSLEGGAFGERPLKVTVPEEVRPLLEDFVPRWSEVSLLSEESIQAALSKLEGYALRFALLIRACRELDGSASPESEIAREDVQGGIRLAAWFRDGALEVYEGLAGPESNQARVRLETICEVIRSRFGGSVTLSEWRRRSAKRDKKVAESELDSLVDAGFAEKRKRRPGKTGGRPTVEYALLDGDHESEEDGVSGNWYLAPGVPPQEEQDLAGESVRGDGQEDVPEIPESGYQKPPTQDPTHPSTSFTPLEGVDNQVEGDGSPPDPPGAKYQIPPTSDATDPVAGPGELSREPVASKPGGTAPTVSESRDNAPACDAAPPTPGDTAEPDSDAGGAEDPNETWKQDNLFEHEGPIGGLGDD